MTMTIESFMEFCKKFADDNVELVRHNVKDFGEITSIHFSHRGMACRILAYDLAEIAKNVDDDPSDFIRFNTTEDWMNTEINQVVISGVGFCSLKITYEPRCSYSIHIPLDLFSKMDEENQNFIMWHELGHMVNGHLDTIAAMGKDAVNNGSVNGVHINDTMEIEADKYAYDNMNMNRRFKVGAMAASLVAAIIESFYKEVSDEQKRVIMKMSLDFTYNAYPERFGEHGYAEM